MSDLSELQGRNEVMKELLKTAKKDEYATINENLASLRRQIQLADLNPDQIQIIGKLFHEILWDLTKKRMQQ